MAKYYTVKAKIVIASQSAKAAGDSMETLAHTLDWAKIPGIVEFTWGIETPNKTHKSVKTTSRRVSSPRGGIHGLR